MKYNFVTVTLLAFALLTGCSDGEDMTSGMDGDDPMPPSSEPQCVDVQSLNGNMEKLIARRAFQYSLIDIWFYGDTVNNRNYALVGFGRPAEVNDSTGVYIVDVTDPSQPQLTSTVNNIGGFDIKTWKNYMYSVSGSENDNGRIVDISDPENPSVVGSFPGSHNIFVGEAGLLVRSFPGVDIFDLKNDPLSPDLLWSDSTSGGHEAAVIDTILYDFHGFDGTNIYDISDPANPVLLSTISPGSETVRFHHSGWVTEDDSLLVITDERPGGAAGNGPDFTVWDVSDKSTPGFLNSYRDENSTVHNVHIDNGRAYFAYYTSGYRVFDMTDILNLEPVYELDTAPSLQEQGLFQGAWGVYALGSSGNVYISDTDCGLHIFEK